MNNDEVYLKARTQFVQLWEEMAGAWGINKTMAQIHALLYAESEPMDTDGIMEVLDISRGNAHINLQRLLDWQLIHKINLPRDRKDYYTAEKDVWNIVSIIIKVRQHQEITPIRDELKECLAILEESDSTSKENELFKERIGNYVEFLEMFERFINAMLPYINKKNLGFLKQLVKLVEVKESLLGRKEK